MTPTKKAFKKVKSQSLSTLKKKAWKIFSVYIRTRDADESGYVACCTCGRMKHWKEGDAGHFIDGRHNSIMFDPRNVHFQCKLCNGGFVQSGGAKMVKEKYEKFMKSRYGPKVVNELRRLNQKTKQFTRSELELIIQTYTK